MTIQACYPLNTSLTGSTYSFRRARRTTISSEFMDKPASTRQLKVARELQRDLAEIIRKKGMAAFGGSLVSVSEVRISPDLSIAKVFVSVFPSEKAQSVLGILSEQKRSIRGELGRMVASQLRTVPEFDFLLDSSLDYMEHIDELLKK